MKNLLLILFALSTCCCNTNNGERIIFNDQITNQEIWQLSQGDSLSLMPYFECQAFTYDDKYAVFKSKRDGIWKLYRTDIANGEVKKISDRVVNGSYSIFANGEDVIFMEDVILYQVNVADFSEKLIYDCNNSVEEEKISFTSSFTNDGEYTIVIGTKSDKSGACYGLHLPIRTIEKVYTYQE